MRSFSAPFVDNGFVPANSLGNDIACIDGRVNKVKSNVVLSHTNRKYVLEFVEMIQEALPEGKLIPVDVDEVSERQPTKTQQMLIDDALTTAGSTSVTHTFQKNEAYGKVTHPRNISVIAPSEKLIRSRVAYALTSAIKQVFGASYAGGITPAEIARKVASICVTSMFVLASDFSRMDGHVSPAARAAEEILLNMLFGPDVAAKMAETLPRRGVSSFGVLFSVGTSRSSGDPFTTIMNTLLYIIIVYCTSRHAGLTKEQAFDHIRLKMIGMGDDGIVGDLDEKKFVATCAAFGQVVKVQKIARGEFGVNFLSRFYGSGVWNGNTNSICDVHRQLSKWHLTTNKTMSPNTILVAKARSFILSDRWTPIIGNLCAKILTVAAAMGPNEFPTPEDHSEWYKHHKDIVSWFAQYNTEDQYPNEDVESIFEHYYPTYNIGHFHAWLVDCNTLEDIRNPPQIKAADPVQTPPYDVVLGGEVIRGKDRLPPSTGKEEEAGDNVPATPPDAKKKKRNRRKRKKKGEKKSVSDSK